MKRILSLVTLSLIFVVSCTTTYQPELENTQRVEKSYLTEPYETPYDLQDPQKKLFNADPMILSVGGSYYMYTTSDTKQYHVYVSNDLQHWSKPYSVYSDPDGRKGLWAPHVFYNKNGDGRFYLYYTVEEKVGVAVADSPMGPFVKVNDLVDWAIDAMLYEDDKGKLYLYYTKLPIFRNGWYNAINVVRMKSPTEMSFIHRHLFSPDSEWEKTGDGINEAPWTFKHNGIYYLMYSGSRGDTNDYAIGYATSRSPLGPFTKYEGNPILANDEKMFGPGHNGIVTDNEGNQFIIYHRKSSSETTWSGRYIDIAPLWMSDEGEIVIGGKGD